MRTALRFAAVTAALFLLLAVAGPAFAFHRHYIDTPGTEAEVARGNTCVESGHAAYHVIHDKLHKRDNHPAPMISELTGGRVSVEVLQNC